MNYFTEAPWAAGATPCKDNFDALAICKANIDAHTAESSGYFIEVFTPDGRRTALVGHGPNGIANGYLIAAAPDLFEALTWAMENPADNAYWMERAKLAIAKAKGLHDYPCQTALQSAD